MREFLLASACAALIVASIGFVSAEPSGGRDPQPAKTPAQDAQHVEPGKVGPGSEKNSQVSPTSPDIPAHKQPPPDINLPANGETSPRDRQTTQEGLGANTNTQPPANAR